MVSCHSVAFAAAVMEDSTMCFYEEEKELSFCVILPKNRKYECKKTIVWGMPSDFRLYCKLLNTTNV